MTGRLETLGQRFELVPETPYRWRIEPVAGMRVPGIVYATRDLLPDMTADRSLAQVAAVATLPGIVDASYAMPDVHWGYGFPIGGVAATDVDAGGVVSPGGVGFDISCGVRLLLSRLTVERLRPSLDRLMDLLDTTIPRGAAGSGLWRPRNPGQLDEILARGAGFIVEQGHGEPSDLENCEDRGVVPDADPTLVGARARDRGRGQLGSLGSGNHFLEVQGVEEIRDAAAAEAYGLWHGQVCVMIHTGSRGLGHQVCSDQVAIMTSAMRRYGIIVPDPQLACVPVAAPEGRAYLAAMAAAANYGRANRQLLSQAVRRAFRAATGDGALTLLYDLSHNLVRVETHTVDDRPRRLCIHRKGATPALPPGHPNLPPRYMTVGQPVLVPGSMGTGSYVLAGVPEAKAFCSACHGAGRRLSRHQAARHAGGRAVRAELTAAGVAVRGSSLRGLAEEAPRVCKNVDAVVDVCERAGLARVVARLLPIGVVKG